MNIFKFQYFLIQHFWLVITFIFPGRYEREVLIITLASPSCCIFFAKKPLRFFAHQRVDRPNQFT